jgi:hypothetical protein
MRPDWSSESKYFRTTIHVCHHSLGEGGKLRGSGVFIRMLRLLPSPLLPNMMVLRNFHSRTIEFLFWERSWLHGFKQAGHYSWMVVVVVWWWWWWWGPSTIDPPPWEIMASRLTSDMPPICPYWSCKMNRCPLLSSSLLSPSLPLLSLPPSLPPFLTPKLAPYSSLCSYLNFPCHDILYTTLHEIYILGFIQHVILLELMYCKQVEVERLVISTGLQ